MEEIAEQKLETFIGKVHRRQNYAQELFGLSQHHIADDQFGSSFDKVVVERVWCSDVAGYITALQNEVARLTYKAEKMCGGGSIA